MTTRIRSHAAAALLLFPLGLAVMAGPAAAQHRDYGGYPVAAAPLIERFVMRPNGRLHAGQEVRFRLEAVPGARAWLDVPGVVSGLPLHETRAGRYEAEYVIRHQDDPGAFAHAVATVQSGPQRQSARVERRGNDRGDRDERHGRDERPPQITDVMPAQGERIERGRTRVAARFDDAGRAGVDPASIALRIDGVDVTARSRVSPEGVEFVDVFGPGRHTAELLVRDRAGNVARRTWSFDVVAARQPAPPPLALPPLHITSHAEGSVVNANQPVRISGRTLPNAVVRVQMRPFALVGRESLPAVEEVVRADARGDFSARLVPVQPLPGQARVELTVTSEVPNAPRVEQRLRMRHQG